MVSTIQATQAREGIDTTSEQADRAYYVVSEGEKAAFFDLGPVQMELIEPVGTPSTWEEFLRTHGEGIHHIAFKTMDMEATRKFLASKGMETVQHGGWDGGQYAYVDCSKQLGTILELLHFDI